MKRRFTILFAAVLSFCTLTIAWEPPSSPAPAPEHVFFVANQGLPDYIHKSPFKANANVVASLKQQLTRIAPATKPCKVGEVDVPDLNKTSLFTNVCDKAQSDALRTLISRLAPDLTFSTTTVWKAPANPSGESYVLVAHVDISTDEHFHYPYLSLWRLEFKDGEVDAQFAGSFLAGEIHAIRTFGHVDKTNKIFVKHLSCIECEPWVYLTVLDLSQPTTNLVQFTYADDHKEFDDTIEYDLPGMGHSIDAKVETRIPTQDATQSVDMFQVYRYTEENKTEWWVFSCKNGQCDYAMFNDELPAKYRSSWESADKL